MQKQLCQVTDVVCALLLHGARTYLVVRTVRWGAGPGLRTDREYRTERKEKKRRGRRWKWWDGGVEACDWNVVWVTESGLSWGIYGTEGPLLSQQPIEKNSDYEACKMNFRKKRYLNEHMLNNALQVMSLEESRSRGNDRRGNRRERRRYGGARTKTRTVVTHLE